jgi:hypothetical protein
LRTSIGSWSAQDQGTFAEFLDSVESRLRVAAEEMPAEKVPQT